MNLILIFPEELTPENCVLLTDRRAVHIRSVLRAEPGKKLRIGLLNGPFGQGRIDAVSERSVLLSCEWEADVRPQPPIDLLLAMPRPKVLKRLWAQFAALGVGRIFITNADKVERYYFDTHILSPDFYTPRLIEGLQQACDTRLPEVTIARSLKTFLENGFFSECEGESPVPQQPVPGIGQKLIADPSGGRSLSQCLADFSVPDIAAAPRGAASRRCCLAIGPEGGWTPYELDLFGQHGFDLFGLGPRILRTDTACIGLISLLAEFLREGV